jgi:hypothetical protein
MQTDLSQRCAQYRALYKSGTGTELGLRVAAGLGDEAALEVCRTDGLIPVRNVFDIEQLRTLAPYPLAHVQIEKCERDWLDVLRGIPLQSLSLHYPQFSYNAEVSALLQSMRLHSLEYLGMDSDDDDPVSAPVSTDCRDLALSRQQPFDNDFLQQLGDCSLQSLTLRECEEVSNRGISALLTLPLRRLILTRAGKLSAKSIARMAVLPLEHLSLDWNSRMNDHEDCLTGFGQLKSLSLNHCSVSDENLVAIRECKLESFEAESNYITVEGLDYLLPMPIRHLHIGTPRGLDDLAVAIEKISRMPLQHFEFSDVDEIEADVLQLIAAIQLHSLDLSLSGIYIKGFKHLRDTTLQNLNLSFCNFDVKDGKALRQFAKSGVCVKSLHIGGLNLCDDDLRYLQDMQLEELNLYDSSWITDKGVKYLASLPLKSLTIGADPGSSKLTDACVDSFSQMPLDELTIINAVLSDSAWERLYQLPARIWP